MERTKEIGYELLRVVDMDGFMELWDRTDAETKDKIVNGIGELAVKLVGGADTRTEPVLPIQNVSSSRFVSATCKGEKCSVCGKNATNKLGEEIPYDDPNPNRHNLTAYVCSEHFRMIFGRLG